MKDKKNYLLEKVVDLFRNLKRGKVLDLGCGYGDYSKRLKDLGYQITAGDIDSKIFKYRNEIEFRHCDITKEMPFPDNSFDYVLLLEVIEHIYNPDFVIGGISKVLKPGGALILSTPNILNLGSRMRFLFEGGFDFFREPTLDYYKVFPAALENLHVIPWRYQEIEYLLFKNGLQIETVSTDLIKSSLNFLAFILIPILKWQCRQKERRSLKKGGVDYRRINKILFSKELLYGRHLIIKAQKERT